MSSEKKIAANRANAMKSSGPRTSRGKAHSRLNGLKLGTHAILPLLPGEDAAAYARLYSDVEHMCEPIGLIERGIVERIHDALWRLDRLKKAEHGALARVEIEIELNAERKSDGDFISPGAIDRALKDRLLREQRQIEQYLRDGSPPGATQKNKLTPRATNAPPLAYTLLAAFGCNNRHCNEIDRRIRATTEDVVRLVAQLEALQAWRNSITIQIDDDGSKD